MARRKHRFYCPDPEEHFTGVRRNGYGPRLREPISVMPARTYAPAPDASKVLPGWFTPLSSFGRLTDVGRSIARYSSDIFGLMRLSYDPDEQQLCIFAEKEARMLYADLQRAGYRVATADCYRKRVFIYPPVPKKTPARRPLSALTEEDRGQYEGLEFLFND